MMAGGIAQVWGADECKPSIAHQIFDDFQSLDSQLRPLSQTAEELSFKVKGEREIKLSNYTWGGLKAYSRTTKLEDGRWVTVQIRRWIGFIHDKVSLDVFDGQGKLTASVRYSDCNGALIISPQQARSGEAPIIQSALLAVTGENYQIVIFDGP